MRDAAGRRFQCGVAAVLVATGVLSASGDIVARIGDRVLSVQEYETEAQELRKTGYRDIAELNQEAKLQLLDGIIARELLVIEGLRRGVDRDSAIAEELQKAEQRALMNQLYEREAVQPEYTFTEADLRQFFVDHQYDTEVLSRHIVCGTEAEARQVLDALAQGVPFESLVPEHSRQSIQDRFGPGGWVGWFKIGDVFEELRVPLSTMAPGQLYPEPVKTPIGYHVFALKERRPVDFASDLEWLRDRMRTQRRADDMARYVAELRRRYDLVAHDEAFPVLRAIPAGTPVFAGPDRVLFTWRGGQLTIGDYLTQLRAGRAPHPAELDSAGVYKAADNLAGRQIMAAEARHLGLSDAAEVREKVDRKRKELMAKWLYRVETTKRVRTAFTDDDVRAFYDQNTALFTRQDGKVTDLSLLRESIRTLLRNQAETRAMDAFLAELREAYSDQVQVYPEALSQAFAAPRSPVGAQPGEDRDEGE